MTLDPVARALSLPIWTGTPTAEPLGGGITNLNVRVTDATRSAVVRLALTRLAEQLTPAEIVAELQRSAATHSGPGRKRA